MNNIISKLINKTTKHNFNLVVRAARAAFNQAQGTKYLRTNPITGKDYESIQIALFSKTEEEQAGEKDAKDAIDSILQRHEYIVTKDNVSRIELDLHNLGLKARASIPVLDERLNAKQLEAKHEERVQQGQEREEAATKRETEKQTTISDSNYSHLSPSDSNGYQGGVFVAKNVRKDLKKNFPKIKFSVISDYNCVNVGWDEGPTVSQVDALLNKFKAGNFDGMTDSYNYKHSSFGDAFGDVQYLFTNRGIDKVLRESVQVLVAIPSDLNAWEAERYKEAATNKALSATDLTGKGAFKGVEFDYEEQRYILLFETVKVPKWSAGDKKQGLGRCNRVLSEYSIEEHTHTKRGFQMFIVIPAERLEKEDYQAAFIDCKERGGWYSRAWENTPGGFAFKYRESAEQFASDYFGNEEPNPEPIQAVKVACIQGSNIYKATLNVKEVDIKRNISKQVDIDIYLYAKGGKAYTLHKAINELLKETEEGGTPPVFDLDPTPSIPLKRPPTPSTEDKRPAKFRTMADGLQAKIDAGNAAMTQNPTPKRLLEQAHRRIEAAKLERVQAVLYGMADAIKAGTLPAGLETVRTKKLLVEALTTRIDASGGYHSALDTEEFFASSDLETAAIREFYLKSTNPAILAEKRKAQEIEGKINDFVGVRIPGFFVTPKELSARMVEEAGIEEGDTVLEPGAGTGNLADAAKEAGGEVTCVEIRPALAEILRLKGYSTACEDFLRWIRYSQYNESTGKEEYPLFDKIVMNPPFERGADAQHVKAAYDCLKVGGRLVAIMGEGIFFREDAKTVDFRAWLSRKDSFTAKLPEGSFKGKGEINSTGVNARIVIIDK